MTPLTGWALAGWVVLPSEVLARIVRYNTL